MPRPSQVRKQQAEKELAEEEAAGHHLASGSLEPRGHQSSGGLEPPGYRLVLHDWRRRPSIGEVVLALLKSQTRAVRAEVIAEDEDGRWLVRPLGGIECQIFEWPPEESVPLGRLAPVYRDWPEPTVVVVDDTHSFRRLARLQVESGDKVVEIGCSYGHCSQAIVGPGDCDLLGLDISDVCVRHCASLQLPRARFEWFNALCSRIKLRRLLATERPDVLVCDINGQRVLYDVLELVEGAMTSATAPPMTPGAQDTQEAAASRRSHRRSRPAQPPPAEAPPPPHVPRVLLLKSEALAAHLAAGAAASGEVGSGAAASEAVDTAITTSSAAGDAVPAEPTQAPLKLRPQPVVARLLVAALLAFCIARRLRKT